MPPKEEADPPCGIRRRRNVKAPDDGFDFRSSIESLSIVRVVKRLDAERVACKEKTLPPLVPKRKGEHPPQVINECLALLLIQKEKHFCIAGRLKNTTAAFQPRTKCSVVINLTVEGDDE